jgi:ribosomal protein S18 acetylase RimI-like enzyme
MNYTEQLPLENEYYKLFLTTGWNDEYHFSSKELFEAIKNSWYVVSVYDVDGLIGFGRVLADGTHHAFIVDLIVDPHYHKKGIGSEILEKLVAKCKEYNIRDIQLFAAKNKSEFYTKHGFIIRDVHAPGMQYNGI